MICYACRPLFSSACMFVERKFTMSKIYDKYIELKKENPEKFYLFRCGNFYIFLEDDAYRINDFVVLKITSFAKNISKCGFPVSSLPSYLKVFQNLKIDVEMIEECNRLTEEEKGKKVIQGLMNLDLDHLMPVDAFLELQKLKEIVDGK